MQWQFTCNSRLHPLTYMIRIGEEINAMYYWILIEKIVLQVYTFQLNTERCELQLRSLCSLLTSWLVLQRHLRPRIFVKLPFETGKLAKVMRLVRCSDLGYHGVVPS